MDDFEARVRAVVAKIDAEKAVVAAAIDAQHERERDKGWAGVEAHLVKRYEVPTSQS